MEQKGFVQIWESRVQDKWHVILPTVSVYASMDDMGKLIKAAHPEYDMRSWGLQDSHNVKRAFGNDWEYMFTDEEIESITREHVSDCIYVLSECEYSIELPYSDWKWLDEKTGSRIDMRVIKAVEQAQKSMMLSYEDSMLQDIMGEYKYTEASVNLGQIFTAAYLYAKRHGCAAFAHLGE